MNHAQSAGAARPRAWLQGGQQILLSNLHALVVKCPSSEFAGASQPFVLTAGRSKLVITSSTAGCYALLTVMMRPGCIRVCLDMLRLC